MRYGWHGSWFFRGTGMGQQGNDDSIIDYAPMFPLVNTGDPRYMMEAALETRHCIEKNIGLFYDSKVMQCRNQALEIEKNTDGSQLNVTIDIFSSRNYHELEQRRTIHPRRLESSGCVAKDVIKNDLR